MDCLTADEVSGQRLQSYLYEICVSARLTIVLLSKAYSNIWGGQMVSDVSLSRHREGSFRGLLFASLDGSRVPVYAEHSPDARHGGHELDEELWFYDLRGKQPADLTKVGLRSLSGFPASGYEYDVAFSFAGEDREYVETVAKNLKARGLDVFYDDFEKVNLWGKDLYQHLHDVYTAKARFCVLFVSASYAEKVWPRHELRAVQERALRVVGAEYMLLARFDETDLPGISRNDAYVELGECSPRQLADLIDQKVRLAD